MAMRYRQKYVVVVIAVGFPLTILVKSPVGCLFAHVRGSGTYVECLVWSLGNDVVALVIFGLITLFVVARKYVNDFWTRRAKRESRDLHR
ncbi:hypothetical protein T484DRAFT_1855561 [Baffinella frigidus]|nr:hypothetical protein T484DRAFT_1855561 [Cryptophyta sp. CCMP2293]